MDLFEETGVNNIVKPVEVAGHGTGIDIDFVFKVLGE